MTSPDAVGDAAAAPAGGEWGWVPWAWAAGTFLVLWALAWARYHTMLASYDLGYFGQAAWLISKGKEPFVTVRGLHLLGDHGAFSFYPMAWLSGDVVHSVVVGLLALQAALLALGAVPLWHIGRRLAGLPVGACVALCAAYSLYPALSNVDLYDFHPEALLVPGLLAAAYLGFRGGGTRPWRGWAAYGACLLAVFGCREDAAVPVLFLGVALAVDRDRRRAGLVTVAAAVVWLGLDIKVVLPHFAGGEYIQGNRFAQYGPTLGAAAKFMLTHPVRVLDDFTTRANAYVLLGLFVPVLLLPLLAPRHLLPGLPLQGAYLLSNVAAAHTLTAQYTVGTIPFVFVATAIGMGRVWRRTGRPVWRLVVPAAALCFAVFATASPRHAPWDWLQRDRADRARLAAARLIPRQAAVSATVRMWPILAERADLYAWPMPYQYYGRQTNDPEPYGQRIARLHWVVIDTTEPGQFGPLERTGVAQLLAPGNPLGYTVVFDRAGIVVYHRP